MVTKEQAIMIAKDDLNLPTAIHLQVMANYKKNNKVGILSYISLENETVNEMIKDGMKYYEISFTKGGLSWQELSDDYTKVNKYYDGSIEGSNIAKCLVKEDDGAFAYTGTCTIGVS